MASNNKDANNAPTPPVVATTKKNDADVESGQVVLNIKHQRKSESGCNACIKNITWKHKQWMVLFIIIAMFTTIFILGFSDDEGIISNLFLLVVPISAVLMYCIFNTLADPDDPLQRK